MTAMETRHIRQLSGELAIRERRVEENVTKWTRRLPQTAVAWWRAEVQRRQQMMTERIWVLKIWRWWVAATNLAGNRTLQVAVVSFHKNFCLCMLQNLVEIFETFGCEARGDLFSQVEIGVSAKNNFKPKTWSLRGQVIVNLTSLLWTGNVVVAVALNSICFQLPWISNWREYKGISCINYTFVCISHTDLFSGLICIVSCDLLCRLIWCLSCRALLMLTVKLNRSDNKSAITIKKLNKPFLCRRSCKQQKQFTFFLVFFQKTTN